MSVQTPEPATHSPLPPTDKRQTVLKTLGEYKELIAVIVFFITGCLWLFGYFATKQQLKTLQCLMNTNMAIIQGKMDSASLSQLMVQNLQESMSLEGKQNLTPAEMLKQSQLKTGLNDISRKLADADTTTAKALNKLVSGECLSE
jgi:hypothetical protein